MRHRCHSKKASTPRNATKLGQCAFHQTDYIFLIQGAAAPVHTHGYEMMSTFPTPLFLVLFSTLWACSTPPDCPTAVPEALRTCLTEVSTALRQCYSQTGQPCEESEPAVLTALQTLDDQLTESCEDGAFGTFTQSDLIGRIHNACESQASSLAWRSFGGPQGAVWPSDNPEHQTCLLSAHESAATLMSDSMTRIAECLGTPDDCDAGAVSSARTELAQQASQTIGGACENMANLIAVDRTQYLDRAAHQIDCITATAYTHTEPLSLSCGPSNAEFDAPRGEWTQIVVDGEKWGTLCGDGSDYAFQIRLAPEGEPLDNVLIGLQGGGVCVFEEDCSGKLDSNPGLFTAMDDLPYSVGIASDDPEESPFANWTKVYLPYCNQDVFAGGGVVEDLGEVQLPRYGAVNIRAAMQMVRDVLWKKLDAEEGRGFRPDELRAFFGGWSAGAYGTLYNYHWFVDDLQWSRTTAFPDAGLALHNGSPLGVLGLGLLKIPAWGAQPHLPPYCFGGECAVGPTLYEAISPRLKRVPEQQFLILTNPKDYTQQYDAYFDDEALWINTMRQSYCDTRDLNGISYYFTSVSTESIHVVSVREELWNGSVDGEVMKDWMWRGYTDPDSIVSRVEEADFVANIEGVQPYPCEVAP